MGDTDLEFFAAMLGHRFELQVDDGEGSVSAELVAATPLKSSGGHGRSPFSLMFRGPAQPVLPQRTYRFVHDGGAVPDMDIFIVPVGTGADGVSYEAVFT